jgi:hypothetical protein
MDCDRVQIFLDGSTSHTHAPDRKLVSFLWEDVTSGQVVGKNQVVKCFYPFGTYTLSLTIADSATETLSTSRTVIVAPESKVPGMCAVPLGRNFTWKFGHIYRDDQVSQCKFLVYHF